MRKRRRKLKNGLGHTISRICILLLIPLILIGAIWGIISLIKNGGSSGSGKFTQMPFTVNDPFTCTGSGFLYITDGILYNDDINKDSKDASYKVNTSEVELESSITISALYNQNTVQIVGAPSAIEGFGNIKKVKCGLDYIAVLFEDELEQSVLKVFDKNATVVDEIRPEHDHAFITDFGFTDTDTNILWTLLTDTASEIIVSTITTYDLSKKATTGIMSIQHQLVESLKFTDNSIFAVGTNDLMRYNNNGNLIYRLPIYGYKVADFASSSNKCTFLLQTRNNSKTISSVKLCTVAESETAKYTTLTLQLPHGTISASLVNDKILACSLNKLYTYSYSGELLSQTELPFAITDKKIIKVNNSEILLHSSPSLYRYKVK